MPTNIEKLGAALTSQMKKSARAAVPTTLELGTIGSGLTLITDNLSDPIPRREYMVALHLTHKDYMCEKTTHTHDGGAHDGHEEGNGMHTHLDGEHTHRAPSVFRRLQVGDRVLVAWVGYEPVVVDIVVSGETITE